MLAASAARAEDGRDAWQKPDAVIEAIGIKPGMTVADLGAGTGYFSVRLAKAVGGKGRVLAIDVEPKLVDYMKVRAAKAQLAQLVPVLAPTPTPHPTLRRACRRTGPRIGS